MISLIAAITKNRVIGHEGAMPWHLPAELAYFKKITLGKTVLMGRRTFESIGKALPYRRNWVLSHKADLCLPGCEIFPSLEIALAAMPAHEELVVIGGATLYEQTLPLANRLYLTFVDCELPGDTYFPEWDPGDWHETSSFSHSTDHHHAYSFRTVQFDRAH